MKKHSWISFAAILATACGSSHRPPGIEVDGGPDADTDVDTDSDTDSDTDTEVDLCGNGVIDNGEICDDNNRQWEAECAEPGGCCSPDCQSDETCGNGYADYGIGEQCDDGNTGGGDGCSDDCSSNEQCGNGIPDPGEACDDGNRIAGDGCGPNCDSDESCDNGVIDWGAGEVCDSTPTCADDCRSVVGCGDGAIGAGETCDDGNTDNHDGCSEICLVEQSVVVSSLEMLQSGDGCDLDGDGDIDNAFADSLGDTGVEFFQQAIDSALDDGSLIMLMDYLGLDDPTGQNDDSLYLGVYQGVDGDDPADSSNNFDGGSTFYVSAASLDAFGDPMGAMAGSIDAGELLAGPEDIQFSFPFGDTTLVFVLARAIGSGTVSDDAGHTRIDRVSNGMLCGGAPAGPMKAVPLDIGVPGLPPSLLDLLVVGFDFLITVTPTQPDVDMDFDGLETFADTNDDQEIDRCWDGDGTEIPGGADCPYDPEVQDAYSVGLAYDAIWSQIIGVR
jgi:cysteine-rich repeat protein